MSKWTGPIYEVSRDGRVFSASHNWRGYGRRELSQHPNASGYPSVKLACGGRSIHIAVHRMVAMLYCEGFCYSKQVRHLDGDKRNNMADNLKWGTAAENAVDRDAHGRTSRGERHSRITKATNQLARIHEYWARRRQA